MNKTLGKGILTDQNWLHMCGKKTIRLIGTRQVFCRLDPLLFIENTK